MSALTLRASGAALRLSRYDYLAGLENRREIQQLRLSPCFLFDDGGVYRAAFSYVESGSGRKIVEDFEDMSRSESVKRVRFLEAFGGDGWDGVLFRVVRP